MIASRSILPLLLAAIGIAAFSTMDAFMKNASLSIGAYNAVLFRSLVSVVLMLPFWRLSGGRWPQWPVMRVHLLRAAVATCVALLFFWGLMRIPMAEGIALTFIAPLIALFLAGILLGEKIRQQAIVAALVGLVGVGVIAAARIGQEETSPDAVWGIAALLTSAAFYAWNLILQRQQAQLASPQEITFFQNLWVGCLLALAAPWLAEWPPVTAWRDISAAAALSAMSLMLFAAAYARAEAQVLVVVEYTAFGWAALMGWLWFGEAVHWTTIIGVMLIVLACFIAVPQVRTIRNGRKP